MRKTVLFSLLFSVAIFMVSCSSGESPKYHPNITAYTSGTISRYAPIAISFAEELPADKQTEKFLSKNIKLKPSCDVTYTVVDNYMVMVQPKESFSRDTEYKVTLKMDEFIEDLESDLSRFEFSVRTLPLLCHGSFGALTINAENDENYDASFTLVTADRENASDAEGLVSFSEKMNIQWNHDATGRVHTAAITNIVPGNSARNISYKLSNTGDYASEGDLLIPDINDFSVYDLQVKGGSERCVYIYFTKNLDMDQDIKGLAYISGNTNERMQIEGNCIKVYYDERLRGNVNIVVNKGIKSSKGLTIQESATFQRSLGDDGKPNFWLLSQGAIVPLSSDMTIQVKSVYFRGLVVRVIEVPEKNIGQFLQTSNLDENGEMRRVGRLMYEDVIFFDDDPTIDLSEPHVFSIGLNKLFNANPGYMYRVEISGYSKLSVFPCSESLAAPKEEIQAYFAQQFAQDRIMNDDGYYYYYYSNGDQYNWREYDDPCRPAYYEDMKVAKNVMATNLGVTAKSGAENTMKLWVNNLIDAEAVSGCNIKIFNFQHMVIGEGSTNSDGYVEIAYNGGKPYYITAEKSGDKTYMKVDDGNSLSMSNFDTSGMHLQSGLNGFIYGDRGVWRPGDTLHIGFMLGDRAGALPKEHPVTLELKNSLGQVQATRTLSKGVLGVYAFNIPIAEDAATGMWSAKVTVGGADFYKYLRIETVMPNRLKIAPEFGRSALVKGQKINGRLHTEWLNGAMARNFKYDMQAQFTKASTSFKAYKDFDFTDITSTFTSEESKLITGVTDENGNAPLDFAFNAGSGAPGMLNATITTKVYEPSGQFSIDVTRKPYSPYTSYVGINTQQNGREALETDANHTIKLATVDADGNAVGGDIINVKIYKLDWYWWWSADASDLADYTSSTYNKSIINESLVSNNQGMASVNFNCKKDEWGTYLIYVKNITSGHVASTMAYFDWPGNPTRYGSSNSATELSFKTDKSTYTVGEKIKFSIPSASGAKALVAVENGSRVIDAQIVKCGESTTQIEIPVTPEMRPNAYINISLIQPYANTENDMPIRLYGVANVTVNDPDSHLTPEIGAKDEILPNSEFSIKISEKDGKEMAYTIAIVDEGLLDLTHFKTPNPWDAFNQREALGVRTWDAYDLVMGAYGGRIEQMFSIGGDEDSEGSGDKALVNRFTPVVKFAGPFYLKKGGSATHKFYMPNYNGKVRTMVVAGNGNAYGSSEKSILVRQPVMVMGTLPRVIGQDEQITVPATVFATKDNVGSVKVKITTSKEFTVLGDAETTLNFSTISDVSVPFKIVANGSVGTGYVTITAKSGNCESVYKTALEIRSIADEITKVQDFTVAAGKEWSGDIKAFGMAGTNDLSIELAGTRPINLSTRMSYLTGYPHGCVEQLVSKAFPQIFLANLTELSDEEKSEAAEAVKYALGRLASYQVFDGSLAYWPGSSYTNQWGTIYAAHFVAEADKAGYSIPYNLKHNLLKYLKNSASGWKLSKEAPKYSQESEITTQAYRLYVLGLNKSSDISSLNRLKEEASGSLSKWLVAGAYAIAGRKDMCEKFINGKSDFNMNYSGYNPTFGSEIRDEALKLQVLCILDHQTDAIAVYNQIASALASTNWYSTQDVAMSLSSIAQFQKKYGKPEPAKGSVSYGKESEKFNTTVGYVKNLYTGADAYEKIVIKNNGSQPIFVHIVNKGAVKGDNTEAQSNGIGLAVSYTDADFNPISISSLAQGTNFIATVTVRNNTALDISNLALTHIMPSGWEILNTRFAAESNDVFQGAVSYQDIRDDRVLSYIDYLPAGKQTTVTLKLTASYLGSYTLPAIKCEAMYNSQINARTASSFVEVK